MFGGCLRSEQLLEAVRIVSKHELNTASDGHSFIKHQQNNISPTSDRKHVSICVFDRRWRYANVAPHRESVVPYI